MDILKQLVLHGGMLEDQPFVRFRYMVHNIALLKNLLHKCCLQKFVNSRLLEGGIIRGVISIDDLHCPILDLF